MMANKIKKILANGSLKNTTLKQRTDLSPLMKTYVHRHWFDGVDTFNKWQKLLSEKEKQRIKNFYGENALR